MPDVQVSELRTRTYPITVVPGAQEALHEAAHCLDTAGQALRRGRPERADEVLALLQAAACHLETAWDMASGREAAVLHGAE